MVELEMYCKKKLEGKCNKQHDTKHCQKHPLNENCTVSTGQCSICITEKEAIKQGLLPKPVKEVVNV
jgi:hypothetical protein